MAPWSPGAHTKPAVIEEKPKRHTKPQIAHNGNEPLQTLVVSAGKADGVEVADIVAAVTKAAGLDGEAVHDVRVLDRFAFLRVPAAEAERVAADVTGTDVRGTTLRLEPLQS